MTIDNGKNIDWNDSAAVEAMLAGEGLGNVDESIRTSDLEHTGVGRISQIAGSVLDLADYEEDNLEPEFDIESIVGENE